MTKYVDIIPQLDKPQDECGVFGIYKNDDDINVVAIRINVCNNSFTCHIKKIRFRIYRKKQSNRFFWNSKVAVGRSIISDLIRRIIII